MTFTYCPVCQGLLSADDTACRICRTPVAAAAPDPAPAGPGASPPPPDLHPPGWAPPTGAPPPPPPPPSAAAPADPPYAPRADLPYVPRADLPYAPPAAPPPPAQPQPAATTFPEPPAPAPPQGGPPQGGPSYPGSYPGQPQGGQPYPGQPFEQPYPGQPYPGQPHPGQPYAGAAPGQAPPTWGPPGAAPYPGSPAGPGAWNLPQGFPPGGAWAPSPPPRRKGGPIVAAIAVTCVLVVLLSGFVVWRARPQGPEHPDQWDNRVLDAVSFVEGDKGKPFLHPVYVDFLPDEEFRATVGSDQAAATTDEDRVAADQQEAMLRALGLVQGDVDMLAEQGTISGSGTAALYDPVTQRVRVRGTEMTPDIEGTVVHELTHAWQDQYFDLNRLGDFPTEEQASAFRMIAEGDAVMTENDWIETLTETERATYDDLSQAASDQAGDELSDVPDVLVAAFGAPYEFGQPFLTGLEAIEGSDYLEKAFADPPSTDEQITEPEKYLAKEGAKEVTAPDTEGHEVIDDGTFGSNFLFLTLAERIDPLTALHATDGWGGDAYAVYDRDGTICVAGRVVGDTAADTEAIGAAMTEWAATLPDATVTVTGEQVDTRACDPGPDADFGYQGRSTKVIAYPVIRLLVWSQGLEAGEDRDRAACYSNAFIDQITLDEIETAPLADDRLMELHRGASAECPR